MIIQEALEEAFPVGLREEVHQAVNKVLLKAPQAIRVRPVGLVREVAVVSLAVPRIRAVAQVLHRTVRAPVWIQEVRLAEEVLALQAVLLRAVSKALRERVQVLQVRLLRVLQAIRVLVVEVLPILSRVGLVPVVSLS